MSIEAWIALIIVLGFVVYFKFDISPASVAEGAKTQKNRNDLVKEIFELARKQGGFWRIDFTVTGGVDFKGFTVFSQNNTQKYYSFNELGYQNINSFSNFEFLKRLKYETEKRKGYYYPIKETDGGWTGGFSSVDGGNSYQMDYDTVTSIKEIHLYSYEYYQKYRPYETSKKSPKYKNV